MATKSKNRRGISRKIVFGYILILVITFLVSTFVFSQATQAYLLQDTRAGLRASADQMEEIVIRFARARVANEVAKRNNQESEAQNSYVEQLASVRLASRVIGSDVAIIQNGKLVYHSDQDMTVDKLKELINSAQARTTNEIFEHREITLNDRVIANLIVYTKMEDIASLRRVFMWGLVRSFAIGSVIALVIGAFLTKRVTKPIRAMQAAIQGYSFKQPIENMGIKTGDELEDLAESFEKMSDRIQDLHQHQKEFFQNASHELKTPLMSIQGYAEAVRDGIVEGPEMEESLDIVIDESQRLKKIVEEMILMTKLEDEAESFRFQLTQMKEIILGTTRSLRSMASNQNVDLDLELKGDGIGDFDVDKMTRAFVNIIGNGIRYADTVIHVQMTETARDIHIDIWDDGPGFEPGHADKVFDRFYKGEKGGSGIGLALTKTIVERHGGKIWAEDVPAGGARFKMIIPRSPTDNE